MNINDFKGLTNEQTALICAIEAWRLPGAEEWTNPGVLYTAMRFKVFLDGGYTLEELRDEYNNIGR